MKNACMPVPKKYNLYNNEETTDEPPSQTAHAHSVVNRIVIHDPKLHYSDKNFFYWTC